ncbi:hypothetical protein [Noviherbaspirillum suwonense]|jgi:hypothetical protein|uniref:hypothetical protein n=1 Tax=Noviherbaspirillum suwonense TaxID=1224511 RepID=UPI0024B6531A|nr:hypothetical protein [Noviherbaspirillum suwonense]
MAALSFNLNEFIDSSDCFISTPEIISSMQLNATDGISAGLGAVENGFASQTAAGKAACPALPMPGLPRAAGAG